MSRKWPVGAGDTNGAAGSAYGPEGAKLPLRYWFPFAVVRHCMALFKLAKRVDVVVKYSQPHFWSMAFYS